MTCRRPSLPTECQVDKSTTDCPFCNLPESRIVHGHRLAVAVRDAYPVAPGHTLVIPRRHVGSFFELLPSEKVAMMELLDQARADVELCLAPDAFTIGINDGVAAGQTVPHVHLHLIPRRVGDVDDPRGGIRWVLPANAKYWP